MENKTINKNEAAVKGQLTFNDKVIQKIVGHAIENVGGLLGANGGFMANIKNKIVNSDNPTEGVDVEVGKEQVAVDLQIIMEFGHDAQTIYKNIKQVVAQDLAKMTELELVEVNVEVVDIQTNQEFKDGQVSLQDRVSSAGSKVKEKTSDGYETVKDKVTSDDSESRVK